jgi:hypothetical protein
VFQNVENNICPFEQIKATKMIFSGGYLKYIEPIFYRKELEFLYLSHISVEITIILVAFICSKGHILFSNCQKNQQ